MKLRAFYLTKDNRAIAKRIRNAKTNLTFKNGLYVLDANQVNNYEEKKKIKGAEIFFFEGNSNPISIIKKKGKKETDSSEKFLNDLVLENALGQTSGSPSYSFAFMGDAWGWITDAKNLMWFLVIGAILYGLIVGGLPI